MTGENDIMSVSPGLVEDANETSAGIQTVRQYVMTKKSREKWLRRYTDTENLADLKEERLLDMAQRRRLRRKSKGIYIFLLVALAAAIAFPLVSLVLSQLTVKEIIIDGECRYTPSELIAASEISEGDRLFGFSRKDASENITEKLPYISSCVVHVNINGSVVIQVSGNSAAVYTKTAGEYYALSSDLLVLERSSDASYFEAAGLIYTDLPDTSEMVVGNRAVFSEPENKEYICVILKALENGEYSNITRLFLDDRYDIVAIYDGQYRILLGSSADTSLKMATAMRVIEESDGNREKSGVVDVTSSGSAGFLAVTSFNPDSRS